MTPQYGPAIADVRSGLLAWRMWGRLGWAETKRRYRRTTIGPFWTTLSLAVFVIVLGVVWSRLWNQDPKTYMPYLTSGMVTWMLFSAITSEGSAVFINSEVLLKQLRIPYTLLACTVVWRNIIVFCHNLLIYVVVCIYAGISPTWATLLVIPGLLLFCLNGVWIALLLALLCARFRDIQQIITSLLQVSMFVTPIFWSPEQLHGRMIEFVDYNILYHYVEIVRAPLLGRIPGPWTWFMVAAAAVAGWAFTFYLFSMFRRRIPYWL
jgi:ABC-type polysaccharide/polyol phosphate export permease